MTGFGSAERGAFKVEIRSLNHRFLDISIKLPQNLAGHDMALRNMLKEKFSRGRFDALISTVRGESLGVKINTDVVKKIYDSLRSLKEELSLSGEIGIDTIARFGEFVSVEDTGHDTGSLYEAFTESLDLIAGMRKREGAVIEKDMRRRLELLEGMKKDISLRCDDAVKKCRHRLTERLELLLSDVRHDQNRVLQEAAIMAEKTDISEEIIRIDSHIDQMRNVLSGGGAIGRKLEFLIQELNREVNTIASKADDYAISSITVDMKSELEKLREQAQNIQ